MRCGRDDLRDHVAGAQDDDLVALADVFALKVLLVVEGGELDGHPADVGLAFALEELEFFSHEVTLLGTYPASPLRRTIALP